MQISTAPLEDNFFKKESSIYFEYMTPLVKHLSVFEANMSHSWHNIILFYEKEEESVYW